MAVFYFIRHGQMDFAQSNTKIYRDAGFNMLPLSATGQAQIKAAARDARLKEAELILASPFGRTMHSAAILSKELGLEIAVETDLHEWMADGKTFAYLPQEEAEVCYRQLAENHGEHPAGQTPAWESAGQMKRRVFAVLDRYAERRCVIVCCHGTLMQYVLGIKHPENGQIVKLER
ncbi:MAG: histidine phosphatase family protein [Subdoligranulum sp.]|nr:histidine phosphatase family protein [Subdoligranulum sp.]